MSALDSSALVAGAQITWKASGGTNVITCTSLGSGSARQGAKAASSLIQTPSGLVTAVLPELLECYLVCQMTSAPAAGGEVQLYWSFSDSATAGTDNQGGLGGTDAALSNVDVLPQLTLAGSVVLSNSIGTGVQAALMFVRPLDAYPIPVIYNNGSVAFDATAGHTILTVTPWYRLRST